MKYTVIATNFREEEKRFHYTSIDEIKNAIESGYLTEVYSIWIDWGHDLENVIYESDRNVYYNVCPKTLAKYLVSKFNAESIYDEWDLTQATMDILEGIGARS